jgi:hypothetical protein
MLMFITSAIFAKMQGIILHGAPQPQRGDLCEVNTGAAQEGSSTFSGSVASLAAGEIESLDVFHGDADDANKTGVTAFVGDFGGELGLLVDGGGNPATIFVGKLTDGGIPKGFGFHDQRINAGVKLVHDKLPSIGPVTTKARHAERDGL